MIRQLIYKNEKDYVLLAFNEYGNLFNIQENIKREITFLKIPFYEDISFQIIAQAGLLSPCHFCRSFKKQVGTTCSRYMPILRIKKANELLKKTDLNVKEVCFRVGYNDLTHFERVFKRLERTTPSSYKHSCDQMTKYTEKKAK